MMTKIADAVRDFERRLDERDYYPPASSADCDTIWPVVDEKEPPNRVAGRGGRCGHR
jgi:hypothetical protein